MKFLRTLVDDIYDLVSSPLGKFKEEDVTSFAHNLAAKLNTRLVEERGAPTLRMSNLGTPCKRQLWYKVNKPELAEALSPATKMKFLLGDIVEEFLFFLAKQAGHDVQNEQMEVELNGVKGHIDGTIDGVIVDSKSASTFSFQKFKDGKLKYDDPFGYIDQMGGYLKATEGDSRVKVKDKGAFLVIDKQHGHLALDVHPAPSKDYGKLIEDTKKILAKPSPPPREFQDVPEGKSGNRRLGTNCSYCDFKNECWPNLQVYLYAKGPTFFTNVEREPRVDKV